MSTSLRVILGVIAVCLIAIVFILVKYVAIPGQKQIATNERQEKIANVSTAISVLRNIASAEIAYSAILSNNLKYGTLDDLINQGFINKNTVTVTGYDFIHEGNGETFKITAKPKESDDIYMLFYITEKSVVFDQKGSPIG